MPPNTVVPIDCRLAAPAPVANISGTTPRMKAKAVIRIGRRRSRRRFHRRVDDRQALLARGALANSTIRMAFFAARPISMTKPICE